MDTTPNTHGAPSPLTVLHSAAGWYVGTLWREPDGFTCPNSRDSAYFPNRDQAAAELAAMQKTRSLNP